MAPDLTPPSEDGERDRLIRTIQQAHGYLTGEWEGEVPDSFRMKTVADLLFNQLHASGALPPEDEERVLLWDSSAGAYCCDVPRRERTADWRIARTYTRKEFPHGAAPHPYRIATLDGGIEHDGGVRPVRAGMLVVVDYDGTADLDDLEPKEAWRWAWVGAARFRPAPPTDERASEDVCERDNQRDEVIESLTVDEILEWADGMVAATGTPDLYARVEDRELEFAAHLLSFRQPGTEPDTPALTEREQHAVEAAAMAMNWTATSITQAQEATEIHGGDVLDHLARILREKHAELTDNALDGGEDERSERVEELREVAYQNPEGVYGEASNAELSALLDAHADRDALAERVRELAAEWQKTAEGCEAYAGKIGDRSEPARGQYVASHAAAHGFGKAADDLTALLARVEGEHIPEQGEG